MTSKPKVEKINLPYSSTVASFFGDQGSVQGNSFLGRMFKGGGRTVQMQGNVKSAAPAAAPFSLNSTQRNSDR